MRIEHWSLIMLGSGYYAPSLERAHLVGEVHEHPHYPDGYLVRTSRVLRFDMLRHEALTKTGSIYLLGRMSPHFEDWLVRAGSTIWRYHTDAQVVLEVASEEAD